MARILTRNVYVADPDSGDVVLLAAGRVPPARFTKVLGAHVFGDDDGEEVSPDAPAPPGGVTGQDPAAVTASAAPAVSEPTSVDLVDGTVEEVLARVGDDKSLAAAALAAEQDKGDKARSTLIEKLEAITQVGAES